MEFFTPINIFLLVLIAIVNVILSAIVAYVATQRGRPSIDFFLLSFFFGFSVGILVLLTLPARKDGAQQSPFSLNLATIDGNESAKCPDCAEWVKVEARVCKHCGADVNDHIQAVIAAARDEKLRSEANREKLLQAARDRTSAFRISPAYKRRIIGVSLAGLLAVAGVVVVVNLPKPSPWESATRACGANSGFTIDENTIRLEPLSDANLIQNSCILSQFSELASFTVENRTTVDRVSEATYKAGKYDLSAQWNFQNNPDGGWGTYTLTETP
jgi:hypothetical protein